MLPTRASRASHRAWLLPTLLATVLAGTALLAGCTDDSQGEVTTSSPTSESTSPPSTTDPVTDAPVEVDANGSGTSCFFGPPRAELAYFEPTWKATRGISDLFFRVVGSTGVQVLGAPITAPPRNFGGRIDYGGTSSWPPGPVLQKASAVVWPARSRADIYSALKDETGLLLFHLEFAPKTLAGKQRSELGDLVARYTLGDGTSGKVRVDLDESFRFDRGGC